MFPHGKGSLCLIIVAFYRQQNIRGMPNTQWFPCSSAYVSIWRTVIMSHVAFYRQQNSRGMPNTQWFPCSSAHVSAWKSVTKSRVAFYRQQNIRGMPNIQWFPCSSAHVSVWKRVIMSHNCRILQAAKHPWNAEYPVISLQFGTCLRMEEGHYVS